MNGRNQVDGGPWHLCGRCDDKTKLNEMLWQEGVLLCPQCVDEFPVSVGIRERMIAEKLDDGKVEFLPHPKLLEPDNNIELDDGDIRFITS